MEERRQVSPWVYVAVGCSVPILLILILVGAAGLWAYRFTHDLKHDTVDERAEKVKAVLGCAEIPEGYEPAMTFSIPFLMDMAILSDRVPAFGDRKRGEKFFDERGFIYVSARGRDQRGLHEFIEGNGDTNVLFEGRSEVRVGDLEPLHRGSFPLSGMEVAYVASRGALSARGQPLRGLVTLLEFKCPDDRRRRIGIWFGPDPAKGEVAELPDLAGTPADEAEIRRFAAHFSPCTAGR